MNHTPTPWKVDKYGQVLTDPSSGCYETIATTPKAWIDNKLFNQDCKPEAITMLHEWSARAQANAEFVVTACNAHEELVKIAQAYRNYLKHAAHTDGEVATYHHIHEVLSTIEKGA